MICAGTRVLAHDASTRRRLGYTVIRPVSIGSRAYVGSDSLILPGVAIGEDAIVGAGSVVTRDVAAGAIVAGNPAIEIGAAEGLVDQRMEEMRSQELLRRSIGAGVSEVERERIVAERTSRAGYVR